MARWNFILTDSEYRPIGEVLNATARKVANPLSKLDTASLQVRLDNPLVDELGNMDGHLKGYRNGKLRFYGPLISAEETVDGDTASLAINAVGHGWFLSKRLAGKSGSGQQFTTLTDRAEIARQIILAADAEYIGVPPLRLDLTTGPTYAASAITYTAGPYRPITECITELATSFDGFDWRILPLENWVGGTATKNAPIGRFVAQDVIGMDLTASVFFEYGTGRNNIQSYKRTRTRDGQANKVYHITNNGPSAIGFPVISAIDQHSIDNWGLLEDLAQADLLDATMRSQLVQEHVRVRKNPREVVEFVPTPQLSGTSGRVPEPGVDYDIGDFVTGRATYSGDPRFDGSFRCYGLTWDIDDMNNEATTITLVDEGDS